MCVIRPAARLALVWRGRKMLLKNIKHKQLVLGLLMAINVFFIVANLVINQFVHTQFFELGRLKLPLSSINGVMQALMGLVCIVMVIVDYRRGLVLSLISIFISLSACARAIFASHNGTALPGIFSCLISLLSVFVISDQFSVSDHKRITDQVTGLKNRNGFEEYIEKFVRTKGEGALLYVHLDGVIDVNTRYGRSFGDELLRIIAGRVGNIVGSKGNVFRLEGPELAVVLNADLDPVTIASAIVESVEARSTVKIEGDEINCYINANIGIAVFPEANEKKSNAGTVMKHADIALTAVIREHKLKYRVYDEDSAEKFERRSELEKLIKEGLENDYFYLNYQPQYRTGGKELRGFEALLRMRLPDGEIVSPGEFIPIAEGSNLIVEVDQYVIKRAMREFADICGRNGSRLTLSINVSAKSICLPTFAADLKERIEEAKFPYGNLEIEMTEYSISDAKDVATDNLRRLRSMGVKVALDDFGTGYTSLAKLMRLPVDLLKIDKSLIDNVAKDSKNRDFVDTVIYLGHLMNGEVIAEGVEEEAQLGILRELNCDLIQGFIWGRPLAYDVARRLAEESISQAVR